jgi:hypothetical protein
MNTMRSKLLMEYNGVEATNIIADDCGSFTWKDNATGAADTMTLDLSDKDGKWMDGFYPQDDDSFKAWLEVSEWAADYRQGRIYCGTFTVDSLSYTGFPCRLKLSGISTPTDSNFNVKQKNRTWEKTTVKTILGDIAGAAGIGLVFDAEDINVDSAKQTGKTDLSFAYSLCSDYGLALKLYNEKMVIYDQTEYEKKEPLYTVSRSQLGGNGVYTIKRQTTTVYDSVKIQYTDTNGKTLTYEYTVPGKMGSRQQFITTKAESLEDAEKKAKASLRENIRNSQTITLKMMGSAKYLAADCFTLSGFGRLDGKYFIDSVTHSKQGGMYTVAITAHLACTDF